LIEEPYRPKDRAQWAANVAYCQWSVMEIQTGLMWQYLKAEGMIP